MIHSYLSTILMLLLSTACFLSSIRSAQAQDKKLTSEELIARHLDSIGTAEARSKASTRVAGGETKFIARLGGSANVDGQAMMVSSGAKLRFGLKLPLNDYPGEDIAFDGAQAAAGLLPQGRRSHLSAFISSQDLPLKEGLIGGTLSTAWPLLRIDKTQPKLDYRGLKKVDGRQLHEVGYSPRKGSGKLKVSLYFDPETFRHVKTKYSFYTLTEDFDDFLAVDGLTLPHKYKIQFSSEGRGGSSLHDWTVTIKKIDHNTKLDDPIFVIK
jgi:hypothetical protein